MKPYIKFLLLLVIPLIWFIGYALSSSEIGWGNLVLEAPDLSGFSKTMQISSSSVLPEEKRPERTASDTLPKLQVSEASQKVLSLAPKADSTKFRILFFGDSMLEGLAPRLCDYSMENDCDMTGVIWYSSTTQLWAETDTLDYFLNLSKPDLVLLCLGSNELFVRDLTKRDKYIGEIVRKLADRPFVWISPPNWREDTGINDLIRKRVGIHRFFDSRYLDLDRTRDKVHPTRVAATYWMDSIVSWMQSPVSEYQVTLRRPVQKQPHKYHQYLLQPVL